ncbi:MAG: DUF2231 domain-containing protein [Desulfohalobiaceae bacterium]
MELSALYESLSALGYSHPLHPTLTHLTMGMVIGALIFGLISQITRFARFAPTARHCHALALIAIVPTAILGIMDWIHFYGAQAMTPIIVKMVLATACLGVLIAAAVRQRRDTEKKAPALSLYLLAFVLVVGLGYFGGEIVFGTHQAKVEAGVNATGQEEAKQEKASFARVKPILENRCTSCHSGSNPPHGLRLTSYKELISGTEHGPIVTKGEPGESELYARITGQSEPRMPFRQSPLSDEQIRVIKEWIAAGASGPQ